VYLYKHGGENAVQTASSLGKREYLHCISLGKAMLAYMSEERVRDIIDEHGLKRYTPQTLTAQEALFDELEQVRERGFAYDEEERIEGIRCVAAPVTAAGDIFGAVSVSGPATRICGERFRDELPDHVTRTANVIEINTKFS
jgi:DNA-binding IclR family transcriptional regulator